jgi:hypothetical protein
MPAEGGQPQVRQPARDRAEHGYAVPCQLRLPAHDDRGDHRDQQARDLGGGCPGSQHDRDDPGRHRQVGRVCLRDRADNVREPNRDVLARDGHSQHVGELPGSHLDADAGEEPDQDGTGQEVRQEPEPGQPGQQQQSASEQGRQPGQPDVVWRTSDRVPGQGRAEYGHGGGVRADDKVARGTQDGEHGHREQQRVQAGHHRHPGDLRVPERHGDAHGGQGDTGQQVRRDL